MSKGPESTNLARVEVGSLTAEQRRNIDDTAALMRATWSSIEKAPVEDAQAVARILTTSLPGITPLEVVKHFDILGNRIYPNAEFWISKAAAQPSYRGMEQTRLEPGTPEWEELLGPQDPQPILAAIRTVAHVQMYDAEGRERGIRDEVEAGYCLRTDAIVSETKWLDLSAAKNRPEAEQLAKERAPADVVVEVFFAQARGNRPAGWTGKYQELKAEAFALAYKTARSRSARRALRKLYPLVEATVAAATHLAQTRIEARLASQAREHNEPIAFGGGQVIRGAGAPSKALKSGEEYGGEARQTPRRETPDELRARVGGFGTVEALEQHRQDRAAELDLDTARRAVQQRPLKAESHHDEAADRAPHLLEEPDRKKLYALIAPRDISRLGADSDHEALHAILREIRQLPPNAPVSTADIVYDELPAIVKVIDALPLEQNGGAA